MAHLIKSKKVDHYLPFKKSVFYPVPTRPLDKGKHYDSNSDSN